MNVSKGIENLGTIQALDGVNNSVITGTGTLFNNIKGSDYGVTLISGDI